MKLKLQFLSVLLTAAGLVSCAPKDDKIVGPPPVTVFMTSAEVNKLTALTLDRAFESLFLLKSSLNETYANSKSLVWESKDVQLGQVLESKTFLHTKDNVIKQSSTDTNYNFSTAMNLEVKNKTYVDNEKTVLNTIELSTSELSTSSGTIKIGKKNIDFVSKLQTDLIEVKKSNVEGLYLLTRRRTETVSSAADRESVLVSKIDLIFAWDGKLESLDNEIAVQWLNLDVVRSGYKKGSFVKQDSSSQINVKLNECVQVNGELNLINPKGNSKPSDKPTVQSASKVVLEDSSVTFSADNYQSKAQNTCSARPSVDLTRMLQP